MDQILAALVAHQQQQQQQQAQAQPLAQVQQLVQATQANVPLQSKSQAQSLLIQRLLTSDQLTAQQRQVLLLQHALSGQQQPSNGATSTQSSAPDAGSGAPAPAVTDDGKKPTASEPASETPTAAPAPIAVAPAPTIAAPAPLAPAVAPPVSTPIPAVASAPTDAAPAAAQAPTPALQGAQGLPLATLLQLLGKQGQAPAPAPSPLPGLPQLLAQASALSQPQRPAMLPPNTSQQALATLLLQAVGGNGLGNANTLAPGLLAQLTRQTGDQTAAQGLPANATAPAAVATLPAPGTDLSGVLQQLKQATEAQGTASVDQLTMLLQQQQQQGQQSVSQQAKQQPVLPQPQASVTPELTPTLITASDTSTSSSNTSYTNYPMDDITNPGPHDVLLGRGSGASNHLGNIRYRMLITQYKPRYTAASRVDKPKVADEIVHFWRNLKPPGRFLTRCNSEEIDEDDDYTAGRWRDVGDSRAKTKTCQCLREKERPRRARKKGD